MPRTHNPDGNVNVTEISNGIILDAATEPGTGIRKRIEVHLDRTRASLTLTHTLFNEGMWPVELAPRAITQFRLVGNRDPADAGW